MEMLHWLREAGLEASEIASAHDTGAPSTRPTVEIGTGTGTISFDIVERTRAPYPNEIARLDPPDAQHALLVAPFVPTSIGAALTAAGWSWADAQGNFDLRAPGLLLRQRRTSTAPKATHRTLPRGSGGLAIVRILIRGGPVTESQGGATALAVRAGVSQPRASQVLGQLVQLGLVSRTGRAVWTPDREALLDRFLVEYRGPGGFQQLRYSLDAPTDVALALSSHLGSRHPVVISADVGADLVAPWRRPSTVLVYVGHGLDVDALGLVEAASPDDANVIIRRPADRSVFPEPALTAELRGTRVPLADPSQMIWDLHDLGGSDRLEAAGLVREWLLTRP